MTGQSDLKIGDWKAHLPYKKVIDVTQSHTKVYYATAEALMSYDKEDESIELISKVEGLSETGVQKILYDQANDQLIVAYTNSVIDIITEDGIFSFSDIKDKSEIQGDKQIYDLYTNDGQFLYLATGFGLVQFDLEKLEFGFTLNISKRVQAVDGHGDKLIIALIDSVFTLDLTSTNSPGFFNDWQKAELGLPDNYEPIDVYATDSKNYILTSDEIYVQSQEGYNLFYVSPFDDFNHLFIHPSPDGWMLGSRINEDNGKSKLIFFDNDDQQVDLLDRCTQNLTNASVDQEGRIFMTDIWDGIRYMEDISSECRRLEVNSPKSKEATDIAIKNGAVYFASGGVTENFGDLFGNDGVYLLEDGDWTNINSQTFPFLSGKFQLFKVAVNNNGSKAYFASFWAGLIEYDTETQEMTLYDETNTDDALLFQVGDNRVRLSGLEVDSDDNLWISNYSAAKPLVVKTADDTWFSYELKNTDTKVEDLIIDDAGLVWVVIGGTTGAVVVYDTKMTLADPTDDEQRTINLNNSEIESNLVYSIAKDLSGSIWVGTGQGAVVFECGSSAIETSCSGNRRKVQQDSIFAFLLETEEVISIAVDGADRKWFGTRNGIFVQSPDGEEQIARFDVDNSPLFDNNILAMAYDGISGIMYISTNKGIQSYKTETTSARVRHSLRISFGLHNGFLTMMDSSHVTTT